MAPRTFAVVGAGVGATLLAAAGITYASTAGSTPASPSAHRAAQPVHLAAQRGHPAAHPVHLVAPLVRPAAPAAASSGDRKAGGQASGEASGERREGRDGGGRGRGRGHEDEGRIFFNERTYSADAEGCITAASGLGASSFSVFNDSRKTIEVFRGFSCDNGAPVAVVGPHGETEGVVTRTFHEGAFGGFGEGVLNFGDDGAVGSFRVVCDHDEW